MQGKQKWTPWENFPLIAAVQAVWLGGKAVFNEKTHEIKSWGKLLLNK